MGRIRIELAAFPEFKREGYHPDTMRLYSKFTELTYRALRLPSMVEFLQELADRLGLSEIEIKVMRMPPRRTRARVVRPPGKRRIIMEELRALLDKRTGLIKVYPGLEWPRGMMRPIWRVGLRGFVLNHALRGVIHEAIHKSGIEGEDGVRELTERHYRSFRRAHLESFLQELKPLLREWRRFQRELGL
jgi:hypothetical protein